MNKKVPLVVYIDGARVVIGECVVGHFGQNLVGRFTITEPWAIKKFGDKQLTEYSLGWNFPEES